MGHELDAQAVEQIVRLFHAHDARVWEISDAPSRTDDDGPPIYRGDGQLVAVARPAFDHVAPYSQELDPSAERWVPRSALPPAAGGTLLVSVVVAFLFGLLIAAAVLSTGQVQRQRGATRASTSTPGAIALAGELATTSRATLGVVALA
jgi:hypothetical protein